jgi:hypothetical protein
VKAWERLRDRVNLNKIERHERLRIALAERKRWLVSRIQELEEDQPSENRDYLLNKYRQELAEGTEKFAQAETTS